jgi:hypothetical protein
MKRANPLDRSKQRIAPSQAKTVGVLGFAAAVALPVVLWHRALSELAAGFQPTPGYFLTGWTPFGLIALGLVLMAPVVYSIGLSSHARAYPRRRNVYAGWGTTLYLLGLALASQVAAIAHSLTPR